METRYHIHVISNVLKIEQIRPLKLAVSIRIPEKELKKAFKTLLSLSVRFLVCGVSGSGGLEKNYGTIAKKIMEGEIVKSSQNVEEMTVNVPHDSVFQEAFKTHKVSKNPLARYYLRAIEIYKRGDRNPEFGGVDDPTNHNLEHIMPLVINGA